MIVKIVAGSPQNDFLKLYHKDLDELLIGVDIGANTIAKAGLKLDVAIGDFDNTDIDLDSIQTSASSVLTYSPIKNETDIELALDYVQKHQYRDIIIYNATGGRIDHFLILMKLLKRFQKLNIRIVDAYNEISILHEGEHFLTKENYQYVSFFPESQTIISLEGFKYPLHKQPVDERDTYLVSNEILSKVGKVTIAKGYVIVIKSR